jgi:glycerol kinase
MTYILAIDQGTTSSRAIAFNREGKAMVTAQQEFTQHFPQPGWVEHDANEIWTTQLAVAREAVARMGSLPVAIGITNQRETTVLWDRASGEPLAPAIVWQDRRTVAACDALRESGEHRAIEEATGLVLDAYFSGTKLAWLLDNIPGARARAEAGELAFGTVDSWLVWNLTGGRLHVTDASNASRTLLMNLSSVAWDPALLASLRIPAALLPRIVPRRDRRDRSTLVRSADSDRRHGGRPAGSHLRSGLLRAGPGQEHVRHWLLHADEHR